jgi:deoxyribonuclease-4
LVDAEVREFQAAVEETGVRPVVAHATYLINLASGDRRLYERSVAAMIEEVDRCARLGIPVYVFHPGNPMGAPREEGIARIARALDRVNSAAGGAVTVCLETTAGTGRHLGATFRELEAIRQAAREPDRVGVVLDTCHLLSAGYDVASAAGLERTIGELDEVIGLDRVRAIHANDTRNPLGSRKDRHEHIGAGLIGESGFKRMLRHPSLRGLPFILETPKKNPDDDRRNLATLFRLAGIKGKRASRKEQRDL